MQKGFLKYLTIPFIACLFYAILQTLYFSYWLINTNNYEIGYSLLITIYIKTITLSPIIFILILTFSIAYQLVQPNLKNIIYAILVALMIIVAEQLNASFKVYMYNYFKSPKISIILAIYTYFYYLLLTLIITGISYLYARYRNLSIVPLNKKLICVFYAGLFIAFSISMMVNTYFVYGINIYTIGLFTTSLIFIFIYLYFFTNALLHNAKDLTNYPYKMILSYIVVMVLAIVFRIAVVAIIGLLYRLMPSADNLSFIIIGLVFTYILAITLFILLLNISTSGIYRATHWALYIIITIFTMWSQLPSINFIAAYGLILFITSLLLYILYLSNKVAINFCFKNKDRDNSNTTLSP